ncbi:YfkD family protein [Rossellomorea sp. YZS02]|uniref:YfkD famly protein n=1 Tax=Rossellomorea sp. YZS02 TaxID=3097358 RepID=UPI002A0D2E1B|nr:YfkD family protein [Rossellomorea sp. YZS02]MDX8342699.1 YfkD family protein [Rossellomorea sp. YZS02]
MKIMRTVLMVILAFFVATTGIHAESSPKKSNEKPKAAEKAPKAKEDTSVKIPNSVLNIAKENTYPNSTQDQPYLQPSEWSQELIETSNVRIENPNLIRMLNESTVNKAPTIGLRATIYLGEWPLNYASTETSPNWEYQKVNTNYFDNRGGKNNYQIHYVQEAQKVVKGGLTAKVPHADDVEKMMLIKAMDKSKLPLAFQTIVGAGTKKDQVYNISPKRLGYLYAYAPAINEKGKVTYGEVYLVMKGTKRSIVVKNVTSQGVGAWIPVQDHVHFGFMASETPR